MYNSWIFYAQTSNSFLTLVTTCIIVSVLVLLVVLFSVFQSRKTKILLDQKEREQDYLKIIGQSQIEIREQTLRNISWELHDNIGQLLTLAKIQLQTSSNKENNSEVQDIISQCLNEIRSLSKSINPEFLKEIELPEALQLEIERLNRMDILNAELEITGEVFSLEYQKEIIIFRILQEFINNTVKHAQASKLSICLFYQGKILKVKAVDNGIGFDTSKISKKGIGILGICEKSKLIGGEIKFMSDKINGTQMTIKFDK